MEDALDKALDRIEFEEIAAVGRADDPEILWRKMSYTRALGEMDWLYREWIKANPQASVLDITVMQLAAWAKEQV